MTNTTAQVWKYISNDTAIKKLLSKGLINNRALAKRIIKDLNMATTAETVVSAIRRYDNWETETSETYQKARKLLQKSTYSSKTNICTITLKKDTTIQNYLPKIFSHIDFSRGEILRIVQGELSVKIIIDEHKLEKILDLIPESQIADIRKHLVEQNILFDKEGEKTPGLVSLITNELSSNNINMEEVLTCVPELIILIDEKDYIKSTKILFQLIKEI
ncbi:MAG: hypothetical protein ABIG84_03965 [archaeon]